MESLIIPLLAALNRARGDATWLDWLRLPGRTIYYVAPLVGLLAWAIHPPLVAAAWGAAYLIWGVPAWGRWFDLGRLPQPSDDPDELEAAIEQWSGGSDHLALFLRHLLFIIPGLALVSLASGDWLAIGVAVPAAALFVLAYEGAWRWAPRQPILAAELIVGALWAGLILLA